MLILKVAAKEVALAQISLKYEAELEQQTFGRRIARTNIGFNTVQAEFGKAVSQDG
jgi:hypothetical protein